MNHPTAEEFEELKRRVEKLEQAGQQIQLLRADVQETNILLKRILPDVGTSREKLDTLEHGQQSIKQDIAAIHDVFVKDFERIENNIGEVNATLSERFDTNERTQAEQGTMLRQILQLLQQQKPGNNL